MNEFEILTHSINITTNDYLQNGATCPWRRSSPGCRRLAAARPSGCRPGLSCPPFASPLLGEHSCQELIFCVRNEEMWCGLHGNRFSEARMSGQTFTCQKMLHLTSPSHQLQCSLDASRNGNKPHLTILPTLVTVSHKPGRSVAARVTLCCDVMDDARPSRLISQPAPLIRRWSQIQTFTFKCWRLGPIMDR